MKIQLAAVVLSVLLTSIFTSPQIFAVHNDRTFMTMEIDKSNYVQGEIVSISGAVSPFKESVPVTIEILDPFDNLYLVVDIPPETGEDDLGLYSYQIELGKDARAGIWTVNAKYASEYTLYDRATGSFRVSESIDILVSPFLRVDVDGVIDSNSGEWVHGYDSKYWKPFSHDPSEVEGNIAFNAYYINGMLYAVFDIPDKKFDSKDFIEVGLDISNAGESFKIGDGVYIFRIFRDGTSESFRLGTEHLPGDRSENHIFSARVAEGGDIRLQVFDNDGRLLRVLDSLRDTSSTSYKGMLGIAGIEVDGAGYIYVLDSDSGMVSKYSPQGTLLGSFGTLGSDLKEFLDPTGIALDSEGNLYVADTGNARVQKFDSQGKFLGAFGSMGIDSLGISAIASQESEDYRVHDSFESPEAVAVGPSGEIYVADKRAGSVNVFDENGNFVESFGSLVTPSGIATDSQGNIYVVEQGNNRVMKFDRNGDLVKMFGTFGIDNGMFKSPYGIAIDSSDHLYVADSLNNRVQKFSSDGVFVVQWGSKGAGEGQFVGPHGIAADSSGNIYVVDNINSRIQKFDSDGKFLGAFGSMGLEAGNFMSPEGIAIDSSGNIYVTDLSNKRVQKFSSDGVFVTEWGSDSKGSAASQVEFRAPFGIAVDASDNVYVADPYERIIQKLDTSGNLILRWGEIDDKRAISAEDIPRGDGYIAFDNNSHEPIGIVDASIVEEQGKGAYFIESGSTWKILHIFQNTIYVRPAEYAKDAVLSWTPDGIDLDSYGNTYIVDRENEVAKKFDQNGRLVLKWGSTGTGDGEFTKPTAMAIDSENNVYIVDTGNSRVQKFDSDGKFLAKWGSTGQGSGQFDTPRGIAIDNENHVYVLDNGNSRVQKFDSNGNFVTQWGSKGSSLGQFDNLSTEGIALDSEGRVYVADLPGEAKATHWIAEVAIPLHLEDDTFGIYLSQGTYGGHTQNLDVPNRVKIYDIYRNTWPAGSVAVLPGTWAKARLADLEEVKIEPRVSVEGMRVCADGDCAELSDADPVLAGSKVIVTATAGLEQLTDKFGYDRVVMTLQYSLDGLEWADADTKHALISGDGPATVNLRWMPLESGSAALRVVASGVLSKEASSEPVNLEVLESEAFSIRANLEWGQDRTIQGERVSFGLAFAGADSTVLEGIDYEVRIVKDREVVAEALPSTQTEDGKTVFHHMFKESGSHIMQVRILGVQGDDGFIPTKKVLSYRIDVLPVEEPVQVSSIPRGEFMQLIVIKNRDISDLHLDTITVSLANIDRIEFRLPEGWSASVSTKDESIEFSTEDDPLEPGEAMKFILMSNALSDSRYDICWDLEQSSLNLGLC